MERNGRDRRGQERTGLEWTGAEWYPLSITAINGAERIGLEGSGSERTGTDWMGQDWTGLDWNGFFNKHNIGLGLQPKRWNPGHPAHVLPCRANPLRERIGAMSEYKNLRCRIRGLCPTILNNGRKANPLDEFAKAIKSVLSTKGRGKVLSDEQAEEVARLEFMGALYVNEKSQVCWPGENLESMILSAAKKQRRGDDCKIGVLVDGDWPLIYDGPKDPEKLWADKRFRKVCMARNKGVPVLKCRPIFHDWELEFVVAYDPDILDPTAIAAWLKIAGSRVGLSDWRPKYGRFEVVAVNEN